MYHAPTFVSDLKVGDQVDLEDDTWADQPVSMTQPSRFAGTYSTIEAIAPDVDDFIGLTFDNGETITFPDDHKLPKVTR